MILKVNILHKIIKRILFVISFFLTFVKCYAVMQVWFSLMNSFTIGDYLRILV